MTRAFGTIAQPVRFPEPLTEVEKALIEQNPFMPIREGYRHISAISAVIKRDEDLARKMCREAGLRESDWFAREGAGPGSMQKALGR